MLREPIWERARGRWHGILSGIGVDNRYLTGKPGPCPICCAGKDRFTFDNKHGDGTFICRHCGAGTGVQFVQKLCRVDFKEASRLIDEHLPGANIIPKPRRQSRQNAPAAMNRLWLASGPVESGDPVHLYLTGRLGEIDVPDDIRYVERCPYKGEVNASFPAMLAMIRDLDGSPCQLHRTYLTPDGQKAPVDSVRRMMPGKHPEGSAIRLCDLGDTLGIAEGIETAMAARKLFSVPVWAALTATRLQTWEPPKGVRRVIVFADNDESFAGLRAAASLAHRIAGQVSVEVKQPPHRGDDWNDHLMKERGYSNGNSN